MTTFKKTHYNLIDHALIQFDQGLRLLFAKPHGQQRESPAKNTANSTLSSIEKKESERLMRINHVGEVCAQALYQGQALTAKSKDIKKAMQHAADEEIDHLAWCVERIGELDGRVSYLNPLWYLSALTLGISAGLIDDKWNLGFLAETERQVVKHLEEQLNQLPQNDTKSRAIVAQMKIDEAEHAALADNQGARPLPSIIKIAMRCSSALMKKVAYLL